jgi:hypothetical protein
VPQEPRLLRYYYWLSPRALLFHTRTDETPYLGDAWIRDLPSGRRRALFRLMADYLYFGYGRGDSWRVSRDGLWVLAGSGGSEGDYLDRVSLRGRALVRVRVPASQFYPLWLDGGSRWLLFILDDNGRDVRQILVGSASPMRVLRRYRVGRDHAMNRSYRASPVSGQVDGPAGRGFRVQPAQVVALGPDRLVGSTWSLHGHGLPRGYVVEFGVAPEHTSRVHPISLPPDVHVEEVTFARRGDRAAWLLVRKVADGAYRAEVCVSRLDGRYLRRVGFAPLKERPSVPGGYIVTDGPHMLQWDPHKPALTFLFGSALWRLPVP